MRTNPLPPPDSDCRHEVVLIQPTVVSSFGCFVFKFWVFRFQVVGASCFGLRFRVLRFRNYHSHSAHFPRHSIILCTKRRPGSRTRASCEKHNHDTRFSSSYNFCINRSRLNQNDGSFGFRAKLWNSIR